MENGYALCLNEWIFDTRIKNELNLLLYISSLTAERGYCYAKNEHFAQKFGEHETSISRKIKKLEALGYINIEYTKKGCEITDRKIRLAKMLIDDYQKCEPTISKNAKDNNTSINNTNNNKYMSDFEEFWELYIPVVTKDRCVEKGSKKDAFRRFQKILESGTDYEAIREGVKKYMKYCHENNILTCGVSVFLNQERWNDTYETEKVDERHDEEAQKSAEIARRTAEYYKLEAERKYGK